MKTLSLQSVNTTNEFDLESLIQEVNEMIRYEKVTLRSKKVFTSAQLSRIHNLKRRIVIRKGFTI
jgi:hypothetical protein